MDEPGESENHHALVGHAETAGPQRRVFISGTGDNRMLKDHANRAFEIAGVNASLKKMNLTE